jgi:aldehyde dehydrogenase (NAD+)
MGKQVAAVCAQRLARSILELGGNNAMIVAPSADLEMAVRAITFSAVGTAGQRCTTLRRLFVHDSIYDTLVPRLQKIYAGLPIGSPLEKTTLVGPLIDLAAFEAMQSALANKGRTWQSIRRRTYYCVRLRSRLLRTPGNR